MNDSMRSSGMDGGLATATPSDADYQMREVEARLDRRMTLLESRRGRPAWAAVFGGAGFILALAALALVLWKVMPTDGAWTVARLSAEEIVLRDAEGIQRGLFSTDTEGRSQLTLSDQDGRERIRLTVLADGSPGVTISDDTAQPRAVLAYLPDGTTNLVLADAAGTGRAIFGLEPDGSARALFADRTGAIRSLVGVGADGEPSISTYERRAGDGDNEDDESSREP